MVLEIRKILLIYFKAANGLKGKKKSTTQTTKEPLFNLWTRCFAGGKLDNRQEHSNGVPRVWKGGRLFHLTRPPWWEGNLTGSRSMFGKRQKSGLPEDFKSLWKNLVSLVRTRTLKKTMPARARIRRF